MRTRSTPEQIIRGSIDTIGDPASLNLPIPPEWVAFALCAQTDPEIFHPDKGGSTATAKSICAACDVRAECLEYAVTNREPFGIWGGMSARERRPLVRDRKAAA